MLGDASSSPQMHEPISLPLFVAGEQGSCLPSLVLIDDDEACLKIFARLIERSGAKNPVVSFIRPEAALEWLSAFVETQDGRQLVIFTDLKMPKLDGFDVIKWIRARSQFEKTPIVVVSSSDLPEDEALAKSLGADAFIKKFPTIEFLTALFPTQGGSPAASRVPLV